MGETISLLVYRMLGTINLELPLVYMVELGSAYGASDEIVLDSILVNSFIRVVAATMHVPLARSDSKMDTDKDDDEVADDFDAKYWQWTVEQRSRF
jgi:hypothetical protein